MYDSCIKEIKELGKNPRKTIHNSLSFIVAVFSALMIWRTLVVITGTHSPVVVVLSGSMEPGFYRGDILFLHKPPKYEIGQIVVFKVSGREIPIVHRIISLFRSNEGEIYVLTKGDNNNVDDRGLYSLNQKWLKKDNILGAAIGYLPKIGILTIWLNDYPILKYSFVGIMGLLVLLGYD